MVQGALQELNPYREFRQARRLFCMLRSYSVVLIHPAHSHFLAAVSPRLSFQRSAGHHLSKKALQHTCPCYPILSPFCRHSGPMHSVLISRHITYHSVKSVRKSLFFLHSSPRLNFFSHFRIKLRDSSEAVDSFCSR